jgi:hypothetical protein
MMVVAFVTNQRITSPMALDFASRKRKALAVTIATRVCAKGGVALKIEIFS